MKLSCRKFRDNQTRLHLFALAYQSGRSGPFDECSRVPTSAVARKQQKITKYKKRMGDAVLRWGPNAPGAVLDAFGADLIWLRDLKPANVFVSQRGRKQDIANLLDLGVIGTLIS
ncbi:hypothetical protein [Adhaeretor mobilis]|nr:hypothetical protein [Adhaeretor mobilis]